MAIDQHYIHLDDDTTARCSVATGETALIEICPEGRTITLALSCEALVQLGKAIEYAAERMARSHARGRHPSAVVPIR